MAFCRSPVAVSRKCCLGEKVLGRPASQACSMEKLSLSVLLQLSAECLHVKLSNMSNARARVCLGGAPGSNVYTITACA